MKFSNFSKFVGTSLITASLAVLPLTVPAHAQSNAPGTSTGTSTQQNSNVDTRGPISTNTDRDHNNWGWLGLLGLAGLAGLARKNHTETVHHVNNDPSVGVRSGNDYR